MWIVDIKLYRVEERLHSRGLSKVTINKVFVPSTNYNLPCDCDLRASLVTYRAPSPVGIVEDDGDGGFCDSGLALLVDKLLEISGPHLLKVGDPENEADGVEDVRLSGAVQPRDRVEEGVEAGHNGSSCVRLEPLERDLLDVHPRPVGRGAAGKV